MTVYYVLFASAVLLGSLRCLRFQIAIPRLLKKGKQHILTEKDVYLFVIFAFLAAIIGLRALTVGADTLSYVADFLNVRENGISGRKISTEIVNTLLKWICGRISANPRIYLIAHAVIICWLFACFIKNNSEDIYLSTLIFIGMFFVPSMNLMRQWLAIAIGLTAFTHYQRGDNKKALFFFILSVLCHTTAVVLVIIPISESVKNKKNIIWPVLIISAIMIVFRSQIFSIATKLIPHYSAYFDSGHFKNEGLFNIKNLIFLIIIVGIAYVLILRKNNDSIAKYQILSKAFSNKLPFDLARIFNSRCNRITEGKTLNNLYTYEVLMVLALAFSLCGTTYVMFHRVVYYFSIFLIVMLPCITKRMVFGTFVKLLIIAAMFVMLYRSGVADNNGISNYLWFWQ